MRRVALQPSAWSVPLATSHDSGGRSSRAAMDDSHAKNWARSPAAERTSHRDHICNRASDAAPDRRRGGAHQAVAAASVVWATVLQHLSNALAIHESN